MKKFINIDTNFKVKFEKVYTLIAFRIITKVRTFSKEYNTKKQINVYSIFDHFIKENKFLNIFSHNK